MSTFTTPSLGNDQDALYPSITTSSPPNLHPLSHSAILCSTHLSFTEELGFIYFSALKE